MKKKSTPPEGRTDEPPKPQEWKGKMLTTTQLVLSFHTRNNFNT